MVDIDALKRRFESLLPTVDERMRRLIAAAESLAIDYGGISIVSRATGVSRRAIARGIVELGNPPVPSGGAIRKPGGGRKRTAEQDATLVRDLERLIEPLSRGDPESPLRCSGRAQTSPGRAVVGSQPTGAVYDVGKNQGWVSVGIDHDTATFAVESIRRWWRSMGKPVYRQAQRLLITADSGGSNGSRVRLWKLELQKLADETGLHISVCHLPPGISKWNKIEHRLSSFISQNWRGKPLVSHGGHCEFDFSHNHSDWSRGAGQTRHQRLPARSQGVKKGDRRDKYSSRLVPRRMELYNSSE